MHNLYLITYAISNFHYHKSVILIYKMQYLLDKAIYMPKLIETFGK